MPCCAAFGCSTKPSRGKRMHRFPRNPERRRLWESKVRRKEWKANDHSFLCEDHFDDEQYECNRVDGVRKLKPNAVPTQFVFTPKRSAKPTKRKKTTNESDDGKLKPIKLDHAYCSQSLGVQQDLPDISDITSEDLNATSRVLQMTSCTGGIARWEVVSPEEKLKALTDKVKRLQQSLAKERREKWKLAKQREQLEAKVSSVFNKDQLAKLSQSSARGTKWSDDTIKKGLELRFACGPTGYDLLLAQNHPLPSVRSLRRSKCLQSSAQRQPPAEDSTSHTSGL